MPDWSYRTVLRPLMLRLGAERSRRVALGTLRRLARVPFGLAAIDFLGHMRADERLRTRAGTLELAGPIGLGALIDPRGEALDALARFGVGLVEIGPVAERAREVMPEWRVDLEARRITGARQVAGVEDVVRNLERATCTVPLCVRIAADDRASARRIAERLKDRAAMFVVENPEYVTTIADLRPVLLDVTGVEHPALQGAAGAWVDGDADRVRALRAAHPEAIIVAGGVTDPEDARRLLDAGANVAMADAGLVCSGPGLIKRCNEALLSAIPAPEPEPLSLEAARRSWFWALLLGVAMFAGGVLALLIGSTRVVLPYDEALCGMTRAQLARFNPRLLPFMAHDRVTLAGTMLSIGIFYAALAWSGIRRGAHWTHVTIIASATIGFLTFFFFLGFGYFDPFHAFVTAILTQFTLLCLVMQPSPRQPPAGEWRESAAWRRGMWGQLLFIVIGMVITGAGSVIAVIGCTSVFVETDLAFLRTTAAELRVSYERLVPLVAHDRASLGGMLIANGIAVWLMAQWGFRAGERWLWRALAWGGNLAFACATIVHYAVGYDSVLHLTPALLGWVAWNVALGLSREWLSENVAAGSCGADGFSRPIGPAG